MDSDSILHYSSSLMYKSLSAFESMDWTFGKFWREASEMVNDWKSTKALITALVSFIDQESGDSSIL